MIGTEPGIALNAKSDAMAIIAARPFCFVSNNKVKHTNIVC